MAENENKPTQVEVVQTRAVGNSFESRIETFRRDGTIAQKAVIATLDNYITAMAPNKPMGDIEGAREQYKLWKMLEQVLLSYNSEDFRVLWNIILMYFNQYSAHLDVFGLYNIYRFTYSWEHSPKDLEHFNKILNLITLTCDPNKRAAGLKKVSFKVMFKDDFPQEAVNRLSAFYA